MVRAPRPPPNENPKLRFQGKLYPVWIKPHGGPKYLRNPFMKTEAPKEPAAHATTAGATPKAKPAPKKADGGSQWLRAGHSLWSDVVAGACKGDPNDDKMAASDDEDDDHDVEVIYRP